MISDGHGFQYYSIVLFLASVCFYHLLFLSGLSISSLEAWTWEEAGSAADTKASRESGCKGLCQGGICQQWMGIYFQQHGDSHEFITGWYGFQHCFYLFARILEGVETCPTDHQPVIGYGLITFEVQVATQFVGAQNCDSDPSLDADIAWYSRVRSYRISFQWIGHVYLGLHPILSGIFCGRSPMLKCAGAAPESFSTVSKGCSLRVCARPITCI